MKVYKLILSSILLLNQFLTSNQIVKNKVIYHSPVSNPTTSVDTTKPRNKYPKRIYLLSYPRTGSNWLGYCIENISNIKVSWASDIPNSPFNLYSKERCSIPINDCSKETALCKLHFHDNSLYKTLQETSLNNALIVIVRNYKECIPRHFLVYEDAKADYIKKHCICFLRTLEMYELCKTKKILFYYEDLISSPKKELVRLHNFLKSFTTLPNKFNTFIRNLEMHKERSHQNHANKPLSHDKILYHSLKLSSAKKIYYDNTIKTENPYIFEKYLKKYKEII